MASKTAIIWGKGMDGTHMQDLLVKKGYDVSITNNRMNKKQIVKYLKVTDAQEIYCFAGVSNVFHPYKNLQTLFESNLILPANILEAIVEVNPEIKFFLASSSLIFGRGPMGEKDRDSLANPLYPYGASKLAAQNVVKMFRNEFGIFACSGILFPHESERRGSEFFTKKVVTAVAEIVAGKRNTLELGDLSQFRDWCYSPDVCEAAYLMLQAEIPRDYTIGSGRVITTREFVDLCFEHVGLKTENYLVTEHKLIRKNDVAPIMANYTQINQDLGWYPKHNIKQIVKIMMEDTLKKVNAI